MYKKDSHAPLMDRDYLFFVYNYVVPEINVVMCGL